MVTPTTDIKIIRPFRWWKTFGINCAIASPAALLVAAGTSKAIDPAERSGELLGGFIGAEAMFGAGLALMICIAQISALNAYYWSGRRKKIYYACLYAMSVAVPLLGFLVLGFVGITVMRPGWNSILSGPLAFFIMLILGLTSYFVGRRIAKAQIATMNGTPPPLPALAPPNPQLVPERVKPSYAWPLTILASAIVIAAAIFYAASLKQQPAPISAPAQEQAEQGLREEGLRRAQTEQEAAATPEPSPSPTPRKALTLVAIAQKISPSVVTLTAYNSLGSQIKFGTGFFVHRDGGIATNWHVISGADRVTAKTSTGELFEIADVAAYDPKLDVALCSVGKTARTFPAISDTYVKATPRVGTSVAVVGTPAMEELEQSLSEGIVSGIRHDEAGTLIQITAPISHGSSGSPVVDNTGALIGIATFAAKEGQSLNFARSFSDLVAIWHDLRPHTFTEIRDERSRACASDDRVKKIIDAGKAHKMTVELTKKALDIAEEFSDVALAHLLAGASLGSIGNYRQAISEHKEAVALEPEEAKYWDALKSAYLSIDDTDSAAQCARMAQYLTGQGHEQPPQPRALDLSPESLTGLPLPSAPTSSEAPPTTPIPGERFPQTRSRLMTGAEIQTWTAAKIRYAINEMFARHGADFLDPKIKQQFKRFNWYHPNPGQTYDQTKTLFNPMEMDNLKLLASYRDARKTGAPPASPSSTKNQKHR